jgi:hypothetical protein
MLVLRTRKKSTETHMSVSFFVRPQVLSEPIITGIHRSVSAGYVAALFRLRVADDCLLRRLAGNEEVVGVRKLNMNLMQCMRRTK